MKHKLIYHTHVSTENHSNEHEVTVRSGYTLYSTHLSRLARDGMTLTCDRETLDRIVPNTGSVSPRQPKNLSLNFSLFDQQTFRETDNIDAICELFCVRRLSRESFQLELKFKVLASQDESKIDKFIDQQLKAQSIAA